MADEVLSQDDIDKLLSALSSGEASAEEMKAAQEERKVKTYDFKRPDKFSKDQIRTLTMLHDNFARLFNTHLSTTLRTMVSVEVVSVEQTTYQEFVQSVANPSVIAVEAVPPLKGNIIMEMNTNIAFSIVDRVFGGTGESSIKTRMLTEIEEAVVKKFFGRANAFLKEAWEHVTEMNPRVESMESNPSFVQIVPPSDMVIIVTLQVKLGEIEGFMNICIPYLVIEPVVSKLTTTFWVAASASKDISEDHVRKLQRKVERAQVPLTVQMGTIDVTIREFMMLGFGDVLQLDTRVDDELPVLVGTKTKFYGRPGTSGKKSALQITRIATEGVENTDE